MTTWSAELGSLWGKLDPEADAWLPVMQHLEDSCEMAGLLWDHWMTAAVRTRMAELFGGDGRARSVVQFMAGLHDLGKISPDFQRKADPIPKFARLTHDQRAAGFVFLSAHTNIPHGELGAVAFRELAGAAGLARKASNGYGDVIGGHHGRAAIPRIPAVGDPGVTPWDLKEREAHLGAGLWDVCRREAWDRICARAGIGDVGSLPIPPAWAQVQLVSIVVMADWMASNVDLFPYGDAPAERRAAAALEDLDLPDPWRPCTAGKSAEELFAEQFPEIPGGTPSAVQRAAVDGARAMKVPGLMIVEAPMGDGKTEAGLLAAGILAERFGAGGIFFALPTMATSNPMFPRVERWLRHVAGGRSTLNLVHSKAALNPDFSALMRGRVASVTDDDASPDAGEVYAASWFRGRRRAALASHVVGTIDQVLFGALVAKHVALRQFALVNKVVIIDEVHAADDFMRVYLKAILMWLGHHRVPVVLMSATLPSAIRAELCQSYAAGEPGRQKHVDVDGSKHHSRITTVVVGELDSVPVVSLDAPETAYRLEALADEPEALVELLRERLAGGGCAAVICSTVGRAQERYAALRAAGFEDVTLVHSKFVAPHRANRERELVAALGRDGKRPERRIVVGTQVLEQSLDVDFDVMVSDVAPMDLLLQRMGRLHRHRRPARPAAVAEPTCFLTGVMSWDAEPPEFDRRITGIYGTWRLLSTLATLGPLPRSIVLPRDLSRLVETAYDEHRPGPDGWEIAWQAALEKYQRGREWQAQAAGECAIGRPGRTWRLTDWGKAVASDPDSPKTQRYARVRDTGESLEVLVGRRDADGLFRLLDDAGRFSGRVVPDEVGDRDGALAKELAACTVSLPYALVADPKVLEAVLTDLERQGRAGWQGSPWLAGQLVLTLDEAGEAELAGHRLAYDTELGLRIVRD